MIIFGFLMAIAIMMLLVVIGGTRYDKDYDN